MIAAVIAARSEPLRLSAEIGEFARVAAYIEEFAMRNDLSDADGHAFLLAAEELFANTLNHSQPRATHIELSLRADRVSTSAVYVDDGGAFDPTLLPEVDIKLPLEKRRIGGLGIHLIRRTMPEFHFERRDGCNVITLGRPLTNRPAKP